MEAYYHKDPRIEEWIDQIIEKVFTVCLLNGLDSEVEFQRGCQIVSKVTLLLRGISTFPDEYLEDGLKQLLEQQLPDARVINNFPSFQNLMSKMLHEGVAKGIHSREELNLDDLSVDTLRRESTATEAKSSVPVLSEKGGTPGSDEELLPHEEIELDEKILLDESILLDEELLNDGFLKNEGIQTDSAIPALASFNIPYADIEDSSEVHDLKFDETMIPRNDNSIEQIPVEEIVKVATVIEPPTTTKTYGIVRTSQVPEQANSLKQVLSKIFPKSTVNWNMNLMGQTFLAKVENILIYSADSELPFLIDDFTKEGWKVFVCRSEDLSFPRRLERGIKQIQRIGKRS